MDSLTLFPFADYWWFYALFTLFVIGMLALDLVRRCACALIGGEDSALEGSQP